MLTLATLITTIVITTMDRRNAGRQLAQAEGRQREAQALAVQSASRGSSLWIGDRRFWTGSASDGTVWAVCQRPGCGPRWWPLKSPRSSG